MDFYQGSAPPKLIPFCSEKQIIENTDAPTIPQVNDPEAAATSTKISQQQLLPEFSSHCQDSEQDVTTYAETVVQRMELAQDAAVTSEAQLTDGTLIGIQIRQMAILRLEGQALLFYPVGMKILE